MSLENKDLCVGNVYHSFMEFEKAVMDFGAQQNIIFVKRDCRRSKHEPNSKEYEYVTYVCKKGGKIVPSRSKGFRRKSSTKCGCPVKVRAAVKLEDGRPVYRITHSFLQHTHKTFEAEQHPSWESEGWTQGWLSTSSEDPSKAYCNYCQKHLKPVRKDILRHTTSTLHIRRSKTALFNETGMVVEKMETPTNPHPHPAEIHTQILQQVGQGEVDFSEDLWDNQAQLDETSICGNNSQTDSSQFATQSSSLSSSSQSVTHPIYNGPNFKRPIPPPPPPPPSSSSINSSGATTAPIIAPTGITSNFYCNSNSNTHDNRTININTSSSQNQRSNITARSFGHPTLSSSSSSSSSSLLPSSSLHSNGTTCFCGKSCKTNSALWQDYLAEKVQVKRLEKERVMEELKTQKLVQQYHRLKIKRLLNLSDSEKL